MQLVVVADSEGRIVGLTASAIKPERSDAMHEISIRAESVGGDGNLQSHLIDLPPRLLGKTDEELALGLSEIQEQMYVDVAHDKAVLRERAAPQ